VIVLDENVTIDQRELLTSWGIRTLHVGSDIGHKGMSDNAVIKLLVHSRRPTFFTRDEDFSKPQLCHARYSLVYLAVEKHDVAIFVRRVLRHAAYRTQAQRLGAVLRVSPRGILAFRRGAAKATFLAWLNHS
jgi:hypothetical protein